jgi:hypothetical protein
MLVPTRIITAIDRYCHSITPQTSGHISMDFEHTLTQFLQLPEPELIFPSLNVEDRRAVHELCEKHGLFSRSEGVNNRSTKRVVVTKIKSLEITDDERDLFIRDFNLPIPVNREPYFSHYIDELDPLLGTIAKYDLFKRTLCTMSEMNLSFKSYSFDLRDKITTAIMETPAYQEFISKTISKESELEITKSTLPGPGMYISLDIVKANYNCLRLYDHRLVLGTSTWEKLVDKYTQFEYFAQAKYFRQLVFGKLNTRRIESLQKAHLTTLYSLIMKKVQVVGRAGNDELYLSTTPATVNETLAYLKSEIDPMWRITVFQKEFVEAYTIRDIHTGELKIKGISKDFLLQAYRVVTGTNIKENDLVAMKDGLVISYKDKYPFS